MPRQARRWNPGDAANSFVRVVLSDAGELLGGLSEDEWQRTLAFFDHRCAYTGETLGAEVVRDHAVPVNRTHCGLHLYGNVLPTTRAANSEKGGRHWREFVEDPQRAAHIEAFISQSEYEEKAKRLGGLQAYCETMYRVVDGMCRTAKVVLAERLEASGAGETPAAQSERRNRGGLALTFVPDGPETAFKQRLLRKREAWFLITYRDGNEERRRWSAPNMSEQSGVVNNVRSRFRNWREMGIASVAVSIDRPRVPRR